MSIVEAWVFLFVTSIALVLLVYGWVGLRRRRHRHRRVYRPPTWIKEYAEQTLRIEPARKRTPPERG